MLPILLIAPAVAGRPDDVVTVTTGGDHGVSCHAILGAKELCDIVLLAIDEAWAAQVDRVGFNAPLPDGGLGGDDGLDVYLSHQETGGAGGAYVICDGEYEDGCVDTVPGDGLASAPSYIVIDPDLPVEQLRGYVHHEFNHVLQYATDFEEPFLSVWEGTAVAAEAWTDPDYVPDSSMIADYQGYPWASAVLQDGYFLDDEYGIWSYYEYGAVVWVRWMDERWGDGQGSIGPLLWASFANDPTGVPGDNEPDVLDAWEAISGDWEADFRDFAVARGLVGTEQGPAWAADLGDAVAVPVAPFEAGKFGQALERRVYPLGAQYLDVGFDMRDDGYLGLTNDAGRFFLEVVDDGGLEIRRIDGATIQVIGTGTVRVVAGWLGPDGLDADDALADNPAYLTRRIPSGEPGSENCGGDCEFGSLALLAAVPIAALRRRRGSRLLLRRIAT